MNPIITKAYQKRMKYPFVRDVFYRAKIGFDVEKRMFKKVHNFLFYILLLSIWILRRRIYIINK